MTDVVRVDTVVELLQHSRSRILDEHGNERSCADLLAAGERLAAELRAHGVGPGDRVAVQMQNGDLYLDLLAAAALGGFVVMSLGSPIGLLVIMIIGKIVLDLKMHLREHRLAEEPQTS